MLTAITVLHILITLTLIGLVLLQDPKGGAMGMLGGGGSSQGVFGATGASNFLTVATRWVAVAFGITCIVLTYYTSHPQKSVTDDVLPAASAPATPGTTAAPEGTTATPAEAPAATTTVPATGTAPTDAQKPAN